MRFAEEAMKRERTARFGLEQQVLAFTRDQERADEVRIWPMGARAFSLAGRLAGERFWLDGWLTPGCAPSMPRLVEMWRGGRPSQMRARLMEEAQGDYDMMQELALSRRRAVQNTYKKLEKQVFFWEMHPRSF